MSLPWRPYLGGSLRFPTLSRLGLVHRATSSQSSAEVGAPATPAPRPSPGRMAFDDGEVFRRKSSWEIARGLLVFRLCSVPRLVNNCQQLMTFSRRIMGRRLFEATIRASVYRQFVAGESLTEIQECMNKLKMLGIRPMLAVPIEEDVGAENTGEFWYTKNLETMLRCVELSVTGGSCSMMQLKVTALMSANLCKRLTVCLQDPSATRELGIEKLVTVMNGQDLSFGCLTEEETKHFRSSLRRLAQIANYAKKHEVRILVDAEYTYLNPALTLVTLAMMKLCNQSKPWIWNTYQCYLKDSFNLLTHDLGLAQRLGICFGVKLVRGAYMDKERKLAKERGYADPINPDWEATNSSYQRSLDTLLELIATHGHRYNLIVASHNEESVKHAVHRMEELGIPRDAGTVCFGQLLGMCDQVSLTLGQAGFAIYKSIPYGSVMDVIPYLVRRAQENQSVLLGIRKERDLLQKEMKRRLMRRS
ncbi:hydroxyproline dehydrogenase [Ambystoma mexicanum]|uniref:hydroxyproline dehydrogenase n=1 Tax=Ambystoma mexicanum TaxID=8296 RepID=UPI0037E81F93